MNTAKKAIKEDEKESQYSSLYHINCDLNALENN